MSIHKGAELLCELHYGDEFEWPDTQCPVCRLTKELAEVTADRDEWVATAKRLSMKLGGVKDE